MQARQFAVGSGMRQLCAEFSDGVRVHLTATASGHLEVYESQGVCDGTTCSGLVDLPPQVESFLKSAKTLEELKGRTQKAPKLRALQVDAMARQRRVPSGDERRLVSM